MDECSQYTIPHAHKAKYKNHENWEHWLAHILVLTACATYTRCHLKTKYDVLRAGVRSRCGRGRNAPSQASLSAFINVSLSLCEQYC